VRRRLSGAALLLGVGLFLGAPAVGRASPSYTGVIQGSFGNAVLAGNIIPVGGGLQFQDNTTTAVYSTAYDSSTNTATLQWGTFPSGAIPFSTLAFQGSAFSAVPPSTTFQLGTLTYTNGTSSLPSLIFGADLTVQVTDGMGHVEAITAAVSHIDILTTVNGGVNKYADADFVTLSPPVASFHVFEGATATANVYGYITGDPMLHFGTISLPPGQGGNGFLVGAPEPSSLSLAALAVAAVLGRRRFRRKPVPA
jgi:hypothetical protein